MKKTNSKKLTLKKNVVAKLKKQELNTLAGGQNLLSFLGEICYSGIQECASRNCQ